MIYNKPKSESLIQLQRNSWIKNFYLAPLQLCIRKGEHKTISTNIPSWKSYKYVWDYARTSTINDKATNIMVGTRDAGGSVMGQPVAWSVLPIKSTFIFGMAQSTTASNPNDPMGQPKRTLSTSALSMAPCPYFWSSRKEPAGAYMN
jgi:hypothetical protein